MLFEDDILNQQIPALFNNKFFLINSQLITIYQNIGLPEDRSAAISTIIQYLSNSPSCAERLMSLSLNFLRKHYNKSRHTNPSSVQSVFKKNEVFLCLKNLDNLQKALIEMHLICTPLFRSVNDFKDEYSRLANFLQITPKENVQFYPQKVYSQPPERVYPLIRRDSLYTQPGIFCKQF